MSTPTGCPGPCSDPTMAQYLEAYRHPATAQHSRCCTPHYHSCGICPRQCVTNVLCVRSISQSVCKMSTIPFLFYSRGTQRKERYGFGEIILIFLFIASYTSYDSKMITELSFCWSNKEQRGHLAPAAPWDVISHIISKVCHNCQSFLSSLHFPLPGRGLV